MIRGLLHVTLSIGLAAGAWAQTNTNAPAATSPDTNSVPAAPALNVAPGWRVAEVAGPKLVAAPVALAFDERGRLYVAEARDLFASESTTNATGRVSVLEDSDRDGVFDTATVLADDLPRLAGLACSRGGVFALSDNEVVYLRDNDGDGQAEVRRTLIQLGGEPEVIAGGLPSGNLGWGPDQRVHVSTAGRRGEASVTTARGPMTLALNGQPFSFHPLTLELRGEPGTGAAAMTFDGWGRQWFCAADTALGLSRLDGGAWWRNPFGPLTRDAARLLPGTRQRAPTDCLAVTLPSGRSNRVEHVFLADPVAQVVHNAALPSGLGIQATVPASLQLTPLVRSDAAGFRPVRLALGPDEAVYIADPGGLPAPSSSTNTAPAPQGRIWRLATAGAGLPANLPGGTNIARLVADLGHANTWVRATAGRLLLEQRLTNAAPLLRQVILRTPSPVVRLETLRALDTAGTATFRDVIQGLADKDATVRAEAVTLVGRRVVNGRLSDALWNALMTLVDDPSEEVRLRTALALAEVRQPNPAQPLTALLAQDPDNVWLQNALLTVTPEVMPGLFRALLDNDRVTSSTGGVRVLIELATSLGLSDVRDAPALCLGALRDSDAPIELALPLAHALALGTEGRGVRLPQADTSGQWRPVADIAVNLATGNSAEGLRADAARVVAVCVGPEFVADEFLLLLFAPGLPVPMQAPIIEGLARQGLERDFDALIQRWNLWDDPERRFTLDTLLQSDAGAAALMSALETDRIPADALTSVQANLLRSATDPGLRRRAVRWLGAAEPDRTERVAQFESALDLAGSSAHGQELFAARCAACHAPDGGGLGPIARTMGRQSPERLLIGLLDPSRDLALGHETGLWRTADQRLIAGVEVSTRARVIHLATSNGPRRFRLEALTALDRPAWSLMPDEVAMGLTAQDVADLLQFLRSSASY